jgi:hypothetical protein
MRSFILAFLLAGCSNVPLENRPCPCSTGWMCCPGAQVCVREGTSCPAAPALGVSPPSATLPLGGSLQLSATAAVSWSVEEPGAPLTVDAQGRLQASSQAGVYHVVATSSADPSQQATAEIAVGPTRLDLLVGTPGGSGNADGVGTAARFGGTMVPGGITSDGNGNLYVADTTNDSIRKVVIATGEVQTVVDHVPSPSRLEFEAPATLYALTMVPAPDGNLNGDWQLARIDLDGKSVQSVGAPWPRHSGGVWFAGDGHGHLVLLEGDVRGYLRLMDTSTGAITTVAGAGTPPANPSVESNWDGVGAAAYIEAPGPIARVSGSDFVFLDEHSVGTTASPQSQVNVRHFDLSTLAVTTTYSFPPTATPSLGAYRDICATGMMIAGGVMFDAMGRRAIYGTGNFHDGQDGPLPEADVGDPVALWCAGLVNVYYLDDALGRGMRVRNVQGTGAPAPLRTLAGALVDWSGPTGRIAYDPAGRLWVRPTSASFDEIDIASATLAPFIAPTSDVAFTFDSSGKAFVTAQAEVVELQAFPAGLSSPALATFADPGTNLFSIAVDNQGHAFVVDLTSSSVQSIDLGSGAVTKLASFANPVAVAWAGDSLVVLQGTAVERLSLADHSVHELAGAAAGFVALTDVAVDVANQIAYLADPTDHRVRALDLRNSALSDLVGTSARAGVLAGALPASLNQPQSLALSPSGDLFVVDGAEHVVLRAHN